MCSSEHDDCDGDYSSFATSCDEDDEEEEGEEKCKQPGASMFDWQEEEDLVIQAVSNFMSDVFPSLMNIGVSYTASTQTYSFANSGKLDTEEGLRRWMLQNGIPNLHRLSTDDQRLITAWVRYTNVKRSDLCREIENAALERKVVSIFQSVSAVHVLENVRAPIWKFGISSLRESSTVPTEMLRKIWSLPKADLSMLRLWAARGGYPLPVYQGRIDQPVTCRRSSRLNAVSRVSRSSSLVRSVRVSPILQGSDGVETFVLCEPPARVEIWPLLKVLGWTNHQQSSFYQLLGICQKGFHSIEDIIDFMALNGIPNVGRLDETDKQIITDMIMFRHVEYEEVKNAQNSLGGLDPSVFAKPLGLGELHSFLELLGFQQVSIGANRLYQLHARRGQPGVTPPMTLKEVRSMLAIHGFRECRRIGSSNIHTRRQKIRCQIWAAMSETPLPGFNYTSPTQREAPEDEAGAIVPQVAANGKDQQQGSGDESAAYHYIENDDRETVADAEPARKTPRENSCAASKSDVPKPKRLKFEESESPIVSNSPARGERLQQMRWYNECLCIQQAVRMSRNSYEKKRQQLLRLWQSSSEMASAVEWSWQPPEMQLDAQLEETIEVLPSKTFCRMTTTNIQRYCQQLKSLLRKEENRLQVIKEEIKRATAENMELERMCHLKRVTIDDTAIADAKEEVDL